MDAGFNTLPYKAAPFVWGSLQDSTPMGFVYQGQPFVVVAGPPGAKYTVDLLGRLSQVTFSNGTILLYNYDSVGNRTSVVTTCGPHGC